MENTMADGNLVAIEETADGELKQVRRTIHCRNRCRQRGIKEADLDLIMLIGSRQRTPGGVYEFHVKKRDKDRFIGYLKHLIQRLDKLSGKAIIVDELARQIITTYHKAN